MFSNCIFVFFCPFCCFSIGSEFFADINRRMCHTFNAVPSISRMHPTEFTVWMINQKRCDFMLPYSISHSPILPAAGYRQYRTGHCTRIHRICRKSQVRCGNTLAALLMSRLHKKSTAFALLAFQPGKRSAQEYHTIFQRLPRNKTI